MPLGHQSTALITLYGETLNSQKLFTKLTIKFIFEIKNEIEQQLCHKCCFFCSNSVIQSLLFRIDQPVRMRSPAGLSQSADCFYSNWDF